MLAYTALLFINKIMTLETEFKTADAPMAKLLSVILIIGQVILAFAVFICLVAMVLFFLPETMSLSIKSELADKLDSRLVLGELLSASLVAIGWFFVLHLLRKVASALIHGDPFLPENITRLRLILILIIATEIIRILKVFFLGTAGETEQIMRIDIRIGTWFFIFIIAAISEAFRHGAALRAEQELTI
jgi:hypothetical protein